MRALCGICFDPEETGGDTHAGQKMKRTNVMKSSGDQGTVLDSCPFSMLRTL